MNPNNLSGINTPFQNLVTNKSITLNTTGGNVFIPNNKGTAVFPVKSKFLFLVLLYRGVRSKEFLKFMQCEAFLKRFIKLVFFKKKCF